MKTNNSLLRIPVTAAILAGIVAVAAAGDYPTAKGASHLMKWTAPTVEKSNTGMACGKCQDQLVKVATPAARGSTKAETLAVKHLCPSCDTTVGTVGQGKASRQVVKHSCSDCGDKSASCCDGPKTGNMKCAVKNTAAE